QAHGDWLFDPIGRAYGGLVSGLVAVRWLIVLCYLGGAGLLIWKVGTNLGTEIFPSTDVGQFQLRLKAPTGTRIEKTEKIAQAALDEIKSEVGADKVKITMGYVGTQAPSYPVNLIHLWTGGPEEAALQVALKPEAHIAIEPLKEKLRERFAKALPDVRFSFEPNDIVSRVMSFGSSTPVEIAVNGPSLDANKGYADKVRDALRKVDSLRDVQFGQALDYPAMAVNIDRERAGTMGLDYAAVNRSIVTATSSSRFVVPLYWADPKSGVSYQVQVELPQAAMNS